jgi:hypothetical protein
MTGGSSNEELGTSDADSSAMNPTAIDLTTPDAKAQLKHLNGFGLRDDIRDVSDDILRADLALIAAYVKENRSMIDNIRHWNSMMKTLNGILRERARYRHILDKHRDEIARRLADAQCPEPDFEAWVREGKIYSWLVRQGFLKVDPAQTASAFQVQQSQ